MAKASAGQDAENGAANERTVLLSSNGHSEQDAGSASHTLAERGQLERTTSGQSLRERFLSVDATHLSPATPLHPDPKPSERAPPPVAQSTFQSMVFNLIVIVLVCAAGVLGWWLSTRDLHPGGGTELPEKHEEALQFSVLGQIFGYVCAILYLGSRIPQLLLNYRRKSTEGVSMLFFLFACIGNFTYVMSIFAYSPAPACQVPMHCSPGEAGAVYGKYIAVNLSWILGSFGTLLLDAGVFVQYFMYRNDDESSLASENEDELADASEASLRRERRRRRSVTFAD